MDFWCVGGLLDEEILRVGLSSHPSSEDSSDKSSELRAHQISVGGSFRGFLHAELSANGSSELSAEVISQSWRQHENPRRAPVDFLFCEEFLIRWFSVETSTFLWSCTRVGIVEELMFANEAYGVGDR